MESLLLDDGVMPSLSSTNNDGDVSPTSSSEELIHNPEPNLSNAESSDEEAGFRLTTKKRVQRFSDSDSDVCKGTNETTNKTFETLNSKENSDNEGSLTLVRSNPTKSRIRMMSASEEDDSESEHQVLKNVEQQLRMKNKKNKLTDKFKKLVNSRGKDAVQKVGTGSSKENSAEESSGSSADEMSSIEKIKEKIKERSASLKMSICDPDTSDEESNQNKKVYKSKPQMKRTKLTSPKPQRMSAKQAMENMQKIKSESNRMLREKEVSLPYHRPKALSLQDIMKRRKPAVTSDGKALPIKMNEEQLKQYATMLKQRQREMMELCKSDTEEDEPIDTNEDMNNIPVNNTVTDNIGSDNANDDEKDFTEAPQTSTEEKELNKETLSEVNAKSPQWNSHTDEEIRENEVSEISHEEKEPINEILTEVNAKSPQFNETKGDTSEIAEVDPNNKDSVDAINKSADLSAEIELVYNDSVEDDSISKVDVNNAEDIEMENSAETEKSLSNNVIDDEVRENEGIVNENTSESCSEDVKSKTDQNNTELESQLISLQYNDSENTETINTEDIESGNNISKEDDINCEKSKNNSADEFDMTEFPDDDADMNDINMDEIDSIIENAEIIKNTSANFNSPALVRDNIPVLSVKPKLTGAPGMVIDLDGTDLKAPRKSGVQLLKERFTFFSKLKTPEEMEREREKRQKPGTLHLKLKQELEEKIAEQRSLEWAKRLDGEKQQQKELNAIRGEDSEPEDELDNLEAKLDEDDAVEKESSSEGEEEPIEDDVCLKDKPRKKNSLIADEAEESDEDGTEQGGVDDEKTNDDHNEDDLEDNAEGDDDVDADAEVSEEDSSEEDSSESEDEETTKPKKGRILKAFEDSDDEDTPKLNSDDTAPVVTNVASEVSDTDKPLTLQSQSDVFTDSQDDVLHLAQVPKQISGEILSSLDCVDDKLQSNSKKDDELLGTQTFSILNSNNTTNDINLQLEGPEKLNVISETQPYDDNLDAVVGMCSGSFSQNFVEFQPPTTQSQLSQSQPIGEDLLNMCTGNFYDNQFVSPADNDKFNTSDDISQDPTPCEPKIDESIEKNNKNDENVLKSVQDLTPFEPKIDESIEKNRKHDENILKSVLDELNEPEIEAAKPLKFFFDGKNSNEQKKTKMDKENEEPTNTQPKKRFVIDSDDETNDNTEDKGELKKKKKFKKKKLEQRALQISDDEEEEYSGSEEADEYLSDNENEEEKLVEYDSEENEVEVQPQLLKKKKKKASEFFEQEAELTSEDEWVGSGDEDEAGLDRMEREEGDADTFHQGRLQRELGQIHMRDVLDQDKREVRLIQELLFEDGDLGGGGRQRKFRWRDADGEEATGTVPDELKDTQEEEFESEEQWRKQRHEREMFLRQLKNEGEKEDDLDVSVNRTTIIKANLTSRTMSSLLEEVNQTKVEAHTFAVPEKKKDIPSPKKPFPVFQQNYHGSLLTRGRGALARLAALATPLVADDDAPKPGRLAPSSKRNFVFAAITPDDEPKVTKRKAETNVGTPRLVKKMKTEEKQKHNKSSLLDHLKLL